MLYIIFELRFLTCAEIYQHWVFFFFELLNLILTKVPFYKIVPFITINADCHLMTHTTFLHYQFLYLFEVPQT